MGNFIVVKQAKWFLTFALAMVAMFSLSAGSIAIAEEEKKKKLVAFQLLVSHCTNRFLKRK